LLIWNWIASSSFASNSLGGIRTVSSITVSRNIH